MNTTGYLFWVAAAIFTIVTYRDLFLSLKTVYIKKSITSPVGYIFAGVAGAIAIVEYIELFSGNPIKQGISNLLSPSVTSTFQIFFILLLVIWAIVNRNSIKEITSGKKVGPYYHLLHNKHICFDQVPSLLFLSCLVLLFITSIRSAVISVDFDISSKNAQEFYSTSDRPSTYGYSLTISNNSNTNLHVAIDTQFSYNNFKIFDDRFINGRYTRRDHGDTTEQIFTATIPNNAVGNVKLLSINAPIPGFINSPVNINRIFNSPWPLHNPIKINRRLDEDDTHPDKIVLSGNKLKVGDYYVQNPLFTDPKDFTNISEIFNTEIHKSSLEFSIYWQSLIIIKDRNDNGYLNQYIVNGCIKHQPSVIYNMSNEGDVIMSTGVFSESIEMKPTFTVYDGEKLVSSRINGDFLAFHPEKVMFKAKDRIPLKSITIGVSSGGAVDKRNAVLRMADYDNPANVFSAIYLIEGTEYFKKQIDKYAKSKISVMFH